MKKKLLTISFLTLAIVCLAKNQPLHSQTAEDSVLKNAKKAKLEKEVQDARKGFATIQDSICYYNEKADSLYRVELELLKQKQLLNVKSKVNANKALQLMQLAELKSTKIPQIIIMAAPKRNVVLPSPTRPSIVVDSTIHERRSFWDRIFFRNK